MSFEMKPLSAIISELQQRQDLSFEILESPPYKVLKVNSEQLLELMQLLNSYGFNYLANLTVVDYDELELVYHIHCIPEQERVAVKVRVPREAAEVASVTAIWPTADWQEREVYDLMGVAFAGHPNLCRVLLPQEFEGHPLRKDFAIKGK